MVAAALTGTSRAGAHGVETGAYARFFCLWLLVATVAVCACALNWPSAHMAGNPGVGIEPEYLPVSIDSFYHARRILDTVKDPGSFYQFDNKIHAPEGSLLAWPWGYDYAMAWIVKVAKLVGIPGPPILILIWLPVVAVLISTGLIMLLARQLSLSAWSTTIAGMCVALSPLTQLLHGVGNIDHHFAEYIFVLAAITFGLRWLSSPEKLSRAATLGFILGVAPCIHNGLFILQLPLLATIAILWAQGVRLPLRAVKYFALTLIATSLAILIPSLAFRLGRFEFYTLSWFHLYVAVGASVALCLCSVLDRSRRSFGVLGLSAVVLLIPLLAQMALAESFLTGKIMRLDGIVEMRSPIRMALSMGPWGISKAYSMLLLVLPLTAAYCAFRAWRERVTARLLFWISALFGLAMLLTQFRLHYFGSFALFMPILILVDGMAAKWPDRRNVVMLAASLLIVLAYWPALRHGIADGRDPAGDASFRVLRPILGALQEACAKKPGVVLADNDAGHYIRYYTECSVIANNFLLTRQHEEKIREIDYLTSLPAEKLPSAAPYVRYVLLRPIQIFRDDTGKSTYMTYSPKDAQLFADLMLKDLEEVPSTYVLLKQASLRADDDAEAVPYIRLYTVEPERAGVAK